MAIKIKNIFFILKSEKRGSKNLSFFDQLKIRDQKIIFYWIIHIVKMN